MAKLRRLQKYQKKIKKYREKIKHYQKRLKQIKFKEKLKNLVYKIGIFSPEEIILYDPNRKERIFPCHLGISFYGQFYEDIFKKLSHSIEEIFPEVFYNIVNLGNFDFSPKLLSKGTKSEFEDFDTKKKKVDIHPTNKFYQILINKRIENNLDMIASLTDLPLYSSMNSDIHFLFGEANIKHRVCVVSSLKLKSEFYDHEKKPDLFEKRIIKETLHEIGHLVLGPEHCNNDYCLMKFCKRIKEVDEKTVFLCNECKSRFEKIRKKFNF